MKAFKQKLQELVDRLEDEDVTDEVFQDEINRFLEKHKSLFRDSLEEKNDK